MGTEQEAQAAKGVPPAERRPLDLIGNRFLAEVEADDAGRWIRNLSPRYTLPTKLTVQIDGSFGSRNVDTFKAGPSNMGMIEQIGEREPPARSRHVSAGVTSAISRLEPAEPRIARSVLLEATRAAGAFQRSALGHLDHHEWSDRVRSDGQRLINVLTEIGFQPAGTTNSK
jgi:hypothetical protein